MTVRARSLRALLLVALAACDGAGATPPSGAPLAVARSVDTLAPDRRAILALWREYLAARPYTYEPKPQWSVAEQKQWPIFDMAMPAIYQGHEEYARTNATVVSLEPVRRGDSREYVIRTSFTRRDPSLGFDAPVGSVRVHAARENGQWVLASALPRTTAAWKRTVVGPVTFVHPPGHRLDGAKARQSVRFIDSLVTAFDAPRPTAVTYYLARDPVEAFGLAGIDSIPPGSTGRSVPGNYMVFSGLPSEGEFYPHELTHVVLGWVLPKLGAPPVVDEALAFWLGGSKGRTWPELVGDLVVALRTIRRSRRRASSRHARRRTRCASPPREHCSRSRANAAA